MIPKPLQDVEESDLESLVANRTHEVRTLDYKRDLNLRTDDHKREIARDVSSFANAAGGDILFGVEEARDADGKSLGYPEKIIGVDNCSNFDDTKLRLESIIRDNIDPRVQGIGIHKVDGFERGPAVIVRVPQSWNGPHMVSFANQTHFFSRNSAGRQPLDVREIKGLFAGNMEIAARVRRMRDERLGRIMSGEAPVALISEGRPKLVVHAIPLAHEDARTINLSAMAESANLMPPMSNSGGWNHRFNLDGFVTYSGPPQGAQRSYSLAFRDGAFEGVTALFGGDKTPPPLRALYIEGAVIDAATTFLSLQRRNGINPPVVLLVAILGARGFTIYHGDFQDSCAEIDRDVMTLPDVLVEDAGADLAAAFRTTFDAMWQAAGWPRSFGYDQQGRWDTQIHTRHR